VLEEKQNLERIVARLCSCNVAPPDSPWADIPGVGGPPKAPLLPGCPGLENILGPIMHRSMQGLQEFMRQNCNIVNLCVWNVPMVASLGYVMIKVGDLFFDPEDFMPSVMGGGRAIKGPQPGPIDVYDPEAQDEKMPSPHTTSTGTVDVACTSGEIALGILGLFVSLFGVILSIVSGWFESAALSGGAVGVFFGLSSTAAFYLGLGLFVIGLIMFYLYWRERNKGCK
jgi:hypothetical protein